MFWFRNKFLLTIICCQIYHRLEVSRTLDRLFRRPTLNSYNYQDSFQPVRNFQSIFKSFDDTCGRLFSVCCWSILSSYDLNSIIFIHLNLGDFFSANLNTWVSNGLLSSDVIYWTHLRTKLYQIQFVG